MGDFLKGRVVDKFKGKSREQALEEIRNYEHQLANSRSQTRKRKLQANIEDWKDYLRRMK